MNAVAPKGWCPTLSEPMLTGDGLLVRVKPPGGVLSAAAARVLAAEARHAGNGVIELTNRAGLQLRGLTVETVAPFTAAMVAARLAHPDPAIERRRAVMNSPLVGDDPGVNRHTASVATAIETMLTRQRSLMVLPPKLGFLVDGGGVLPLGAAGADISVVLDGDACWITAGDGPYGLRCDPEDAADLVMRLALAFLACADALIPPPRRMRSLTSAIGEAAVFAAAGFAASRYVAPRQKTSAVGWHPYGVGGRGAFGVGLAFGVTDAAELEALATLSERFGDGTLRVTRWRVLAIPGVARPDALAAAVTALGLIADPGDPRLRLFGCPGQPSCATATVETRVHAASLLAVGFEGTLHLSGCAKGCAHGSAADITVVGDAGGYGIVRKGRAGDVPVIQGLTMTEVLARMSQERGAVA